MERFYCVKCREKVEVDSYQKAKSKTGRPMRKSICPECGSKLSKFVPAEEA